MDNKKQQECYDLLQKIDFGDIDGMYDPNLESYFIDRNYFSDVFTNNKFFIIGRKGTGKSALYNWTNTVASKSGDICINILFNEFPFNRLLELKDNSFAQPYQYQTICKNMILGQFAASIVADEKHFDNEQYNQLKYYVDNILGQGIDDCFRRTINKVQEKAGGLTFPHITGSSSSKKEEELCFNDGDLTQINSILQKLIIEYLKIYSYNSKFIIQIDGVDENYNQVTALGSKMNDYLQLVISLLKSVYGINQKFHQNKIKNAKCIVYLRSDIFNSIHALDPESARWEQNMIVLSWVVEGHRWLNNDLRRMINARISASIEKLKGTDGFSHIIDYQLIDKRINGRIESHLFEYMVNRTFHRPRDILQFMIKIKESSIKEGVLNYKTFDLAEKEYSLWFLSEIRNEISPQISDTNSLFSFLRTVGSKRISKSDFKKKYEKFEDKIGMNADDLINYLYNLGIISNVNDKGEWFSIIRNEKSTFNPDIKLILHPGFWKGLYTSTF